MKHRAEEIIFSKLFLCNKFCLAARLFLCWIWPGYPSVVPFNSQQVFFHSVFDSVRKRLDRRVWQMHTHAMHITCVYKCTYKMYIYLKIDCSFHICTWLSTHVSCTHTKKNISYFHHSKTKVNFQDTLCLYALWIHNIPIPFKTNVTNFFWSCSFICITENCAYVPEEDNFFI